MSKTLELLFKLDVAMNNKWQGYISSFEQRMTRAAQKLNELNNRTGQISAYQKLQGGISDTNAKLMQARRNYQDLTLKTQGSRIASTQLLSTLQAEQGRLARFSTGYGKNSDIYKDQVKRVKELEQAYKKSESETRKFEESQGKAAEQVKKLESSLNGQREQARGLQESLRSAGINTRQLASEQSRLQAQMDKITRYKGRLEELKQSLSWGNIKADFMKGYAMMTPFQKPIKLSADFESAMARVQAAGFVRKGSDLSQLEELRKQALHLGDSTKYTSLEAAATQEVLIRGGVKVPDVLKVMPTVMAMASAENLDLNRSAEILVGLMSSMNIPMEQAEHVADVLAIMSASYKTSINDMYEGMKNSAGVGNMLKMPIEHLAALTAIAQQMGVDVGTSGNALKSGLVNLVKPPKDAREALSELGITIKNNKGQFRDITQILADLHKSLSKLGEADQAAKVGAIFGKRTIDLWSKLIAGSGRGLIDEAVGINYNEADGTVKKMEAIIMQTYNGNKALFESSIAGLQTWIGDKVKPIQEYVMNKATSAISTVTATAKANESISAPIAQAAFMGGGAYVGAKVVGYAGKALEFGKTFIGLKAAESAAAAVTTATTTAATSSAATVSAVEGVTAAATGTASAVESIGAASTSAASAVSASASSMLASLGAVSALVGAIYSNWQQFKSEGIHMNDELIKMKSSRGSNRDTTQSPGIFGGRKRALGGLITRPEIALIGEAGPEVIIPLSPGKKTRGMQMLSQAASSLGVNILPASMSNITDQPLSNTITNNTMQAFTNTESDSDIMSQSESLIANNSPYNVTSNSSRINHIAPSINITVNASGGEMSNDSGRNVAENIYNRVKEALSEIMSNQERVSYA